MSVWNWRSIREFAVFLIAGVVIGAGLARRHYIDRMPRTW